MCGNVLNFWCHNVGCAGPIIIRFAANDFELDGKSDLVWRNREGSIAT